MNCVRCNERFEPATGYSKYCSNKCCWAVHNEIKKEHNRKSTGFYQKRIDALTAAGYIVIDMRQQITHYPFLEAAP